MPVHCIRSPLVPSVLRSCVAVGAHQVPRFWATVHDLTEMMALAPNTRRNVLASIWENELGRIWNDAFDDHIDALKELESAW